MSLREILARNLRRLRAERGLSQEELAHRAGVNRNYVGMIEREENAATVDMMEQLAGKVDELPANHAPNFAPVIDPTLRTGITTMLAAAGAWLQPT